MGSNEGNWKIAALNLLALFFRSVGSNIQGALIMNILAHRSMTGKSTQYTDYMNPLNVVYFLTKISQAKLIFTVVIDT